MKLFVMDMKDDEGCAIDLALRAQDHGHEVRYWLPKDHPVGKGLVTKPREWKPSMDWAELIVLTGNCDYPEGFDDYFTKGYPIFGTNPAAAELELNRGKGQEVLKRYGVETLPYKVVDSPEEAITVLLKAGRPFALKPWGGSSDKAMTAIPRTLDEAIFTILRWKRLGLFKGQLMMQECVKGIEMGISGFFGPGGWNAAIEESFEHKKFLNDDLGGNTGEMGTVIRHVDRSKLFDTVLDPLSDHLHLCHFVGDCSVNCIIDEDGIPWPLEFTMRLGWPDFCIRQAVIKGDPLAWMSDLIYGRDSLEVSKEIVVGVVMTHGDFPREDDSPKDWTGFPIDGITDRNLEHLHFQQVQDGPAPVVQQYSVVDVSRMLTAGTYVMIVTGSGDTVEEASDAAYEVVEDITWASNIMYRTDIGDRLEEQLGDLHDLGFAIGMDYE